MTRKHFEATAAAFKKRIQANVMYGDRHAVRELSRMAEDMADIFAQVNPRFDRNRFLIACDAC